MADESCSSTYYEIWILSKKLFKFIKLKNY